MTPTQAENVAADMAAVEKRFRELEATLFEETWFRSNPADIIGHPAFRAIVALGPAVIPLMLRDIEDRPSRVMWAWALPEIVGQELPPEGDGPEPTMTKLDRAWLRWGRERGLKW